MLRQNHPLPSDVPKYNSDQFKKEFNIKNSATLIKNKPWFNTDVQKMFWMLGLHPSPRELNAE